MEELWKDIPEYEGLYQASTLGNIRTHANKTTSSARFPERHWKQRILKPKWQRYSNGRADARVELWKDGKHKTLLVARLVALTWVDGYDDGMTVNHKDGNPQNNNVDNLEWVTIGDNIRHGFDTGLYTSLVPVTLMDDSGNKYEFKSLSSASRWLGHNVGYLSNCKKKHTNVYSSDGKPFVVC